MNYLLIPAVNIVMSIVLFIDPDYVLTEQTTESFVIFFFVICLMRVVEFFTLIRRSVLLDAKIYLESKREFSGYTKEELKKLMEELGEKTDQSSLFKLNQLQEFVGLELPYKEKHRGYGMGNIRLGRTLELDDSIYSLGFIC